MFTKLNRVLLASGLAVASAAMLSPAVFAADTAFRVLSGTIEPAFTLIWDNSITPIGFTITPTGVDGQVLGNIAATGTVPYKIMGSSISTNPGQLKGDDGNNYITYTLKLGSNPVPNTTASFEVYSSGSGLKADFPSTALTLDIAENQVTGKPAQVYTDTLTLTTQAQ